MNAADYYPEAPYGPGFVPDIEMRPTGPPPPAPDSKPSTEKPAAAEPEAEPEGRFFKKGGYTYTDEELTKIAGGRLSESEVMDLLGIDESDRVDKDGNPTPSAIEAKANKAITNKRSSKMGRSATSR